VAGHGPPWIGLTGREKTGVPEFDREDIAISAAHVVREPVEVTPGRSALAVEESVYADAHDAVKATIRVIRVKAHAHVVAPSWSSLCSRS
jgi:hypothetical protein